MFGIPLEALTMLGSSVLGGVMTMWGQAAKDKQDQFEMMMKRNQQIEEGVQNARQMQNPNAAWIRRFIVVSAMLGGLGIVFLAPILDHSTFVPVEVRLTSLRNRFSAKITYINAMTPQ